MSFLIYFFNRLPSWGLFVQTSCPLDSSADFLSASCSYWLRVWCLISGLHVCLLHSWVNLFACFIPNLLCLRYSHQQELIMAGTTRSGRSIRSANVVSEVVPSPVCFVILAAMKSYPHTYWQTGRTRKVPQKNTMRTKSTASCPDWLLLVCWLLYYV